MAHEGSDVHQYGVRTTGLPDTLEYRIYLERGGALISPFHDIPLFANPDHTVLNMVVEIPRWTNAKFEVSLFILPQW
jgi:inorganic pyrophosphatase